MLPNSQQFVTPPNAPLNLTADEAKASLGIANNIMEQFLPSLQQQENTQTPQEQAKNQPTEQKTTEEQPKQEDQLQKDFEGFKGEVKGIIDTKFNDLKEMIRQVIEEEDKNE